MENTLNSLLKDKNPLKSGKITKKYKFKCQDDFLLEFLQLLGRHIAQFFCHALAALRIVEIITNKVKALH